MHGTFAPAYDIRIQGLTLAADVSDAVVSVSYESQVDAADMFTVTLDDSSGQLRDSALFDVGKTVEIHMGYHGALTPMMLGEITAVSLDINASGAPTLTVSGYDRSHRLRHNQPERFTFKYLNDSAIAAIIAAENLLIPIVDPAPTPPRESIQQTGSDWAFLSELAERNFFEVKVEWDRLYFRFPRPQFERTVLEIGRNLVSFSPRISIAGQIGVQILRSYDERIAQDIVMILPTLSVGGSGEALLEKVGSAIKDQLLSLGRYVVRRQKVENYVDAAVVAKSLLMHLLEGLLEGHGECVGTPTLKPGEQIEIVGAGERFSTVYTISKARHTIDDRGYRTQFEVTQRANTSILRALRRNIRDLPSPSRQDPIEGAVVAKVANNVDQEGRGRVQVTFPTISGQTLSAWARLATPYAGAQRGFHFLPEIGDEVLVLFLDGNPDRPIVVGSMWNGVARPTDNNADGLNAMKTIRSRSGLTVTMNDTPGTSSLELSDGLGSTITLNQATGEIRIVARTNVVVQSGAAGKIDLNPPASGP